MKPEQQVEMQEDLEDNLEKWSDTWLLGFNLDKWIKIHIGPNRKFYSYQLYGKTLRNVKEEKKILSSL